MISADFSNRTALITGAANGIGRTAGLAFAKAGAQVLVSDVDVDAGEQTVAAITALGARAEFVRCDVRNAAEVEQMVARAVEIFGGIDFAFNNAGIEEERGRLAEVEEAAFDRIMDINVKGVWLCMKYQLRHMVERKRGVIVNMASVAGLVGAPLHAAYCASKHAVVGLTKSAAVEYAKRGIRVNAVCPAVIRTEMFTRAIERDPRIAESAKALNAFGRIGEPEEVANAVLWLCSDAASFVTGHMLSVDGGMTAT